VADKPRLAVFKFASCDGCQLSLLDAEDELLPLCDKIDIAHFAEASSRLEEGPFDISLVEGSITTADAARRIQEIRRNSKFLMTIGACATAGGIQALRQSGQTEEWVRYVYPSPEYIDTLATSTAISNHVPVDYELHGCPINHDQLVKVLLDLLAGRRPSIPSHSVCLDCKRKGNVCVTVAAGVPCLGPVTHAGCGAICPTYNRGCYGCYGPMPQANAASLADYLVTNAAPPATLVPLLRNFNAAAPVFRSQSDALESRVHRDAT
jgi:coenzyme F420-reducing hydrogenase gamma subunit